MNIKICWNLSPSLRTKQPVGQLVANRGRGRSQRLLQTFLAFGTGIITAKRFPLAHCGRRNARSTSLQLEHPSRLQEHALLTTCFKRSWFQNRWNSVHFKQHASERLRAGGRAKNFEVPTSDPCLSVSLKTAPCATPNLAWHANSEINSEAYYPSQECGEHPW